MGYYAVFIVNTSRIISTEQTELIFKVDFKNICANLRSICKNKSIFMIFDRQCSNVHKHRCEMSIFFVVALCNRADHYIFVL